MTPHRRSIERGSEKAHAEKIVQERFKGKRPANLDAEKFTEGEAMLAAVKAVFDNMEVTSGTGPAAHAEAAPKTLSFAEAAEFLSEILDLNAARDAAVAQQEQWRLVQALIEAGVVRDSEAYGALFDSFQFTETGLHAVLKSMQRGEPQLAVFNPGGLTLPQAFETLFINAEILSFRDSYAFHNLGDVRIVRPDQIEGLGQLHTSSRDEQIAAFKAAYEKASPLALPKPTILFTPNQREVTATGRSATNHMQRVTRAVDPMNDWIRWRMQVDTAVQTGMAPYADRTIDRQMPDSNRITQYPSFILPNGGVLAFYWNPDDRRVILDYYYPDFAIGNLGPRLALA